MYDKVIITTQDYFGPATERFVSRQIRNHFHIEPEQLTKKDLGELITWLTLTLSHLTEDTTLVEQYKSELGSLVQVAG